MINYYVVEFTTYHNSTKIGTRTVDVMCDESKVDETPITITWENLTEQHEKLGALCYFTVWNRKRGRIVDFLDIALWGDRKLLKEWKHEPLNIEIRREWKKIHVSIQEVLHYRNGEIALQYLKERDADINIK